MVQNGLGQMWGTGRYQEAGRHARQEEDKKSKEYVLQSDGAPSTSI